MNNCVKSENLLLLGMNDVKSSPGRATKFPLLALLFATAVGLALTALRIGLTKNWHYMFLVWNLFLAWLPLVFALVVYRFHRRGERIGWQVGGFGLLWLVFFPNASYIFTDLSHLVIWFNPYFWLDMVLFLVYALTGFLLGFLSLYLMQAMVAERLGRVAGWLFIFVVEWLSGFATYLGRFLRWNSWDVLLHPLGLTHSIGHLAAHPLSDPTAMVFPTLFATFLLLGYLMLYALTHLQPPQAQAVAA